MKIQSDAIAYWEENVYRPGHQINRYPYEGVIAAVLGRFASLEMDQRGRTKVLDLGCGAGNHVWFLAREGFDAYGIDGSPSAVRLAEHRLSQDEFAADLKVGDFQALPWPDNFFDAAIDRAALSHNRLEEIHTAVREVHRVLTPGALFYSHIFSAADKTRSTGEEIGVSCYRFSSGRYSAETQIFFASQSILEEIFAELFRIERLTHHISENLSDGTQRAYWEVSATRL